MEASRFIAESYFDFITDCAVTNNVGTSKKLFSKYPGRPSPSQLASFLHQRPQLSEKMVKLQMDMEKHLFPQWQLQLETGLNLALYGYGSKTLLLDAFTAHFMTGYHVFRYRAYSKGETFGDLLKSIVRTLAFDGQQPLQKVKDLLQQVLRLDVPILIVIEMADAPGMRSAELFRTLTRLIERDNIHLLLTFEHLNSLLLAEEAVWEALRLIWHDATTMVPYSLELSTVVSLNGTSSEADSKWQGAKFVLASLTKTARDVFRVIALHQLNQDLLSPSSQARRPAADPNGADSGDDDDDDDEEDGHVPKGISLVAWYQQCQEQFLVSNEIAFRTQLTEFLDHELVRSVDDLGQNGTEFYIPFDSSQIQQLSQLCNI